MVEIIGLVMMAALIGLLAWSRAAPPPRPS